MKQFILVTDGGVPSLGVRSTETDNSYEFADGTASVDDLLNGDFGDLFEVLSLEQLSERIKVADVAIDGGF